LTLTLLALDGLVRLLLWYNYPLFTVDILDSAMIEKRQFERRPFEAFVEVRHPALGEFEWRAKDISEGGIFVRTGTSPKPPLGTVLKVRLKRHGGMINIEPLEMKVIHQQPDGIGLLFLLADDASDY
jgi:hypothetical protein